MSLKSLVSFIGGMPNSLFSVLGRTTLGGLAVAGAIALAPQAHGAHAIAQYGEPKYPAGFAHFEYVNPNAPAAGMLLLPNPDRRTSFDKFNPFTLKGVTAPGVAQLMFETLTTSSADEVASAYGMLAEDIAVADDGLSVTFRLNPKARFSNGDPVLANDVKHSFDTLMSKAASPSFRTVYADIRQAVVLGPRAVRFDFKQRNAELPLIIGNLPVFSPKWGLGADGKQKPFDKLTFDTPIGSGPYLIESFEPGRTITFRRNPQWWASDLNVRRGMFNFERVRYRLYKDDVARLEAFKAGEFDAVVEYRAKNWAKSYVGPRFRSGELVRREFNHRNGAGMQGFIFNLRRPLFADIRVRQALALALDFEWMNRQLFYDQYRRIDSYFTNSDLSAMASPDARPDPAELALLEPLRGQLDPVVFGPAPQPSVTAPPASLRANLREARKLLEDAGWTYRDGALRNARNEPFAFEILDDGGGMGRVIAAYVRNLEKLGIRVKQRNTDYALYQKRIEEFDFDMIVTRFPDSQSPGNELFDRYGSAAADVKGSDNIIGIRSPAVDALVGTLVKARTRAELVASARALDRVLLHGHYVVPHWYGATHRVAYRAGLRHPERLPMYYTAEGWILSTWWREGR